MSPPQQEYNECLLRRDIYCPYHFMLVLVHAEGNAIWKKWKHVHYIRDK